MSKKFIRYISLLIGVFVLLIIYLSTVGIETEKFNKQIQNLIKKKSDKLEISLKKIKLTLDPLNFKINAKTIDAKIFSKGKLIELEYIKTQISLNSFIQNKLVASQVEISTKSILLKNFVSFVRSINNRPELFLLEQFIKKGYLIADLKLNFDELGELKQDYKINGFLKEGKFSLSKNNELEKINFLFDITGNNFNFRDISFDTNDINFLSERLKIKKDKKDYFFEGSLNNKNSTLNKKLLQKIKLKYPQFDLINVNFESFNDFSFNINRKRKVENLKINSKILIDNSQYKRNVLISKNLIGIKDLIDLKDHKIEASYANKKLLIKGKGKVKLIDKFESIDYEVTNKDSGFDLVSNIELSELNIKNYDLIKEYLPKTEDTFNLKDHKIKINYKDNVLSLEGSGKIKLEKEFNKISYAFLKENKKYNFETDLQINDTPLKIDFINYKKDKKLNSQLKIIGSYTNKIGLDLKKISLISKNNRIIINNLILDSKNKIARVNKVDLDYFDNSKKRNNFVLSRINNDYYELKGSLLNADSLITNLLKGKDDQQLDIFKENINMTLNFSDVYIDNDNIVKDLKGNLQIEDNKVIQAKISALFDSNNNLTFSINTTKDGEKITTFHSSEAKPCINRYKFIKGF